MSNNWVVGGLGGRGKQEAKIVISHSLAWDNQPKIYKLFYQSVKIDLVEEVEHFSTFSLSPRKEEEKTRM